MREILEDIGMMGKDIYAAEERQGGQVQGEAALPNE